MNRATLLSTFALVLATAAIALVSIRSNGSSPSPSTESSPLLLERLGEIRQEQDRLAALLQEDRRRVVRPRREPASDTARSSRPDEAEAVSNESAFARVEDRLGELESRLELLEKSIDALAKGIREQTWLDPPPSLEVFKGGKQETDWGMIEGVFRQSGGDRNQLTDIVRGMTYEEILALFGPPINTQSTDGKWLWVWQKSPDADRREPRYFAVHFSGGYVVGVRVSSW